MDLDKAENEIKENTEPEIPSISAALAAPVVLVTAPIIPAAALTALAATLVSTRTAIPALLN